MGFAEVVRESTREDHDRAENSPFVADLMGGELDSAAHADLLEALLPVYVELEAQLAARSDDPSVALFDDRHLDRGARIQSDLRALGRGAGRTTSTASRDYERIVREASSPQRLLAHHYTRYLGDMSGGQVVASRLRTHYDIPAGALTFYDFEELGPIPPYRTRYRERLDSLPWTQEQKDEFIQEAKLAFRANTALFTELGESGAISAAGSRIS